MCQFITSTCMYVDIATFYKFQNKKYDCINQIIGTAIAIHTTANMKKYSSKQYLLKTKDEYFSYS